MFLKKEDFLGHCSFTQLFHDAEKLTRKQKNICDCHTNILVGTTCRLNIFKKLPEPAKVATLENSSMLKKPRHVSLI